MILVEAEIEDKSTSRAAPKPQARRAAQEVHHKLQTMADDRQQNHGHQERRPFRLRETESFRDGAEEARRDAAENQFGEQGGDGRMPSGHEINAEKR
jgi:hypothetical protein